VWDKFNINWVKNTNLPFHPAQAELVLGHIIKGGATVSSGQLAAT
jgi:hypothetical protein